MSKIDRVVQWIALVSLVLSVIGNFVIFGYFDSERTKRTLLEAEKQKTEYQICQKRGHEAGTTYLTSPPIYECRWCGIEYEIDVVQEINPPIDSSEVTDTLIHSTMMGAMADTTFAEIGLNSLDFNPEVHSIVAIDTFGFSHTGDTPWEPILDTLFRWK